jgi:hypothetical protein
MLKAVSVNNSITTRMVGATLAIAHLFAFFAFVLYLNQSDDGQARLLWALWLPVDFPVSLAVFAGFEFISPDHGIGSLIRRVSPYFVHGVLGTVWWYFLPFIVKAIYRKFTEYVLSGNNR